MRQRLYVGGVDRHHRIEEEGQVDALGLDGELEVRAVTVEGPRPLQRRDTDAGLIAASKKAILERAFGGLVG